MRSKPTVFVIDEDRDTLSAVGNLVRTLDLRCETYTSGQKFLDEHDRATPGCVVTELKMMTMSGLQIQRHLLSEGDNTPIIFLATRPDIPTIVLAMRNGAVHFLEKPFREQDLWEAIQEAVQLSSERFEEWKRRNSAFRRITDLTRRERQVLELIGQDKAKKAIASELGVCVRTVEIHRANLMTKLEVETVPALRRIAETAIGGSP